MCFCVLRMFEYDAMTFAKVTKSRTSVFWTPGISSTEGLAKTSAVQEQDDLKDDIFVKIIVTSNRKLEDGYQ